MSDSDSTAFRDSTIPCHVAIIMDGNGRWAKKRGLPRIEGHRQGAETVRTIVKAAGKSGVSYLTLFGFSSENWNRPSGEVHDLMGLMKFYLKKELAALHENNVRFQVIGDRTRLSADILRGIIDAEDKTDQNTGLNLVLALSYGGRADITMAVRSIARQISKGDVSAEDITEDLISGSLYTGSIPEPDLLIRTGGDQRISNFLLWQMAYTEFMFLDCFWPEFDEAGFVSAISAFGNRDRRFGNIGN